MPIPLTYGTRLADGDGARNHRAAGHVPAPMYAPMTEYAYIHTPAMLAIDRA